jgi:aspartate aminotransferase
VIGLGAGEPDFDTPDFVKEAAIEAIRAARPNIPMSTARPSSRQAIVAKFKRDNGLTYADQISVNVGRQAHLVQRAGRDDRGGRRSDHPRALLGELSRCRPVRGGTPVFVAAGADQGYKIRPSSSRPRSRRDQVGDPQLAVQPDRRRL